MLLINIMSLIYVTRELNTYTAKLNNSNCHPLEAVFRYLDPQLQVGENYPYLLNLGPKFLNMDA